MDTTQTVSPDVTTTVAPWYLYMGVGHTDCASTTSATHNQIFAWDTTDGLSCVHHWRQP